MSAPARSTWTLLKRLLAFGRPYAPYGIGIIAASSMNALASSFLIWFLANTVFAGRIPVDRLPEGLQNLLAPLAAPGLPLRQVALWGGVGTLLVALSSYLKGIWSGQMVWRVVGDLRQRLCDKLLELDLSFYQRRKSGDLISRLNNDVSYTQSAVTFLFQDLLQQPVAVLTGLAVLLALDARLTLATVVVLPILVWPLRQLSRRIRKAGEQGAETLGEITQATHQILGGIRIVKAFHAEDREREGFAAINRRFYRKMMSIVRARAASAALVDTVAYGILATGGGVALTLMVRRGFLTDLQPEHVGSFLLIGIQRVFSPIRSLGKSLGNVQATLPGAARVFELLDERPRVMDAPGARTLPPLSRQIAFEDVGFAYDGTPVLDGVSLTVEKGWIVAIVGPSGAGKSTLLSLLPRFYDPQRGRITLDGVDLREASRASLLGQIGVVSQEPFLFHATLRENIAYGRPGATAAEIEAAARAANLEEVIARLPQGYDTVVGERGLNLSGGERQRVAIARALLRNPGILILDEATSALDTASERAVQDALDRLMKGRTTLVIAHRLSTVLHADRIAVLDQGRLAALGTHAALMAEGGLYRRLYEMQFAEART